MPWLHSHPGQESSCPTGLKTALLAPPEPASGRVNAAEDQPGQEGPADANESHDAEPCARLLGNPQLHRQAVGNEHHRRQHGGLGCRQGHVQRHHRGRAAVEVGDHRRRPDQARLPGQAHQFHHRRQAGPEVPDEPKLVQHPDYDDDRDDYLEQIEAGPQGLRRDLRQATGETITPRHRFGHFWHWGILTRQWPKTRRRGLRLPAEAVASPAGRTFRCRFLARMLDRIAPGC